MARRRDAPLNTVGPLRRSEGKHLLTSAKLPVGLAVAALVALMFTPAAAATNYTVSSNPYSASVTLRSTELWDTHELNASNGQNVAYSFSVTTSGGCASLLFVKGHNANLQSQYYTAYSTVSGNQLNCVTSYSNSFPVGSSDGTLFTVLITTTQNQDVDYTVSVNITTPVIPTWLVGLLAFIGIVVVVALVGALIRRRRRKPALMPPMAPPYVGPGAPGAPMPPQQYPP